MRVLMQTTFRVGLALLTGVERELLTADFEQVHPRTAALASICVHMLIQLQMASWQYSAVCVL